MKAVFEVEFDEDMMIDAESLGKEFSNDWMKFMEYLIDSDGLGIFDPENFKLVAIKESETNDTK